MYSSILFVLFLLSFTSSVLSTKDDETELLKIKRQLGNPDNLSWWVKGFDYCNESANVVSDKSYITCTSTGRVSYLLLQDLVVTTTFFPDAICSLTEIEHIMLDRIPGLYGSIPSCITKLPKPFTLYIQGTSLSGSVPSFYNHANINHIFLPSNHLSGTIPASLLACPNLNDIGIQSNYLTGTIPPGLVHGSSPSLVLSNNNLTGKLPKFYEWVDFRLIVLGNNHLSGDAYFLFGKQKMTGNIELYNNDFEFNLSQVEFSDYILQVDLSHNKIYGKVPESFATAARLYFPNLSFNRLCGELPQGGNMYRFNAANFSNNACLCGNPLPACNISTPTPAPAPSG